MKRREFMIKSMGGLLAGTAGLGTLLHGASASAEEVYSPLVDHYAQWRLSMPKPPCDESDPNVFVFSRFKYQTLTSVQDIWNAHPFADENVLALLRNVSNMKVSNRPWAYRVVNIDDFDKIRRTPILFMTGEGDFSFTAQEAATIGEFFRRGGFLYADDCLANSVHNHLYTAFQREIQKTLPGCRMEPMPHDHEIYHCFYDFPGQAPVCGGPGNPDMGLFYKKRLVAFLTGGDVHCGWALKSYGERKHQDCLNMGVNIIIYALTH